METSTVRFPPVGVVAPGRMVHKRILPKLLLKAVRTLGVRTAHGEAEERVRVMMLCQEAAGSVLRQVHAQFRGAPTLPALAQKRLRLKLNHLADSHAYDRRPPASSKLIYMVRRLPASNSQGVVHVS